MLKMIHYFDAGKFLGFRFREEAADENPNYQIPGRGVGLDTGGVEDLRGEIPAEEPPIGAV